MIDFTELKARLASPCKICITTHTNPDGDAIGSSLALYHFLTGLGHHVTVIVPTSMPDFLMWMPGADKILVFEDRAVACISHVRNDDILFSLDYNQLKRIDDLEKHARESKALKVMIDHHMEPELFADYMVSDTTASSTCELIYDFIQDVDSIDKVSIDTLRCIYVGLLTDTGGFFHATSPKLLRKAADLVERGIDNYWMQDKLFNNKPERHIRLLGFCLSSRMEILADCAAGIIAITQQDHVDQNIKRGDMEGVVNYILKIEGIKVAVLVSERKKEIKLSFRSKGSFSVQDLCVKYFNGGGHKNASGGNSTLNFEETVAQVREILQENKEAIVNSVVVE